MPDDVIYVPLRRKLYDDIVRFSDGRIDPAEMAQVQLENWVARDLEDGFEDYWGDRFEEAAEEYAPHLLEKLAREREQYSVKLREERKPLVWKEISVPAGSEVRMPYGDTHHYAKVERGSIVDDGKEYSPSEWASKIAGGTSRNAWRDIWFREPYSKTWIPAQLLRDQAREATGKKLGGSKIPNTDKQVMAAALDIAKASVRKAFRRDGRKLPKSAELTERARSVLDDLRYRDTIFAKARERVEREAELDNSIDNGTGTADEQASS